MARQEYFQVNQIFKDIIGHDFFPIYHYHLPFILGHLQNTKKMYIILMTVELYPCSLKTTGRLTTEPGQLNGLSKFSKLQNTYNCIQRCYVATFQNMFCVIRPNRGFSNSHYSVLVTIYKMFGHKRDCTLGGIHIIHLYKIK